MLSILGMVSGWSAVLWVCGLSGVEGPFVLVLNCILSQTCRPATLGAHIYTDLHICASVQFLECRTSIYPVTSPGH